MAKLRSKYQPVEVIEVYLWGKQVGAVALDPKYNYYAFAFSEKFRRTGIDISPLKIPVATTTAAVLFTDLPELTFKRLPAFLADCLPDDFGNALISKFMADQGISPHQITPLDRLAYMGTRAMGALEFKPQRGLRSKASTAIELGTLVQEARNVVHGNVADDDHTNAALRSIIEVGTSAGGARAKAVIAWNPATNEIRSGQSLVDPGYSHWLLKFDGVGTDQEFTSTQDYGRIEYAYYLMAKEAGITMSECRLLEENGRAHFMTKRFDRGENNTKHHMQTLCAMAHVDYKKIGTNSYSQLFLTINSLELPRPALVESFRRMVFNVLASNCDDHSKNFSFLLKEGGSWELSPAYDLTFAYNPKSQWVSQHLMSVNEKYRDLTVSDLYAEASKYAIGEAKHIIDEVSNAIKQWPDFARKAGVNKVEIERIQNQLWNVPPQVRKNPSTTLAQDSTRSAKP